MPEQNFFMIKFHCKNYGQEINAPEIHAGNFG